MKSLLILIYLTLSINSDHGSGVNQSEECKKYWAKLDSLSKIKQEYFRIHILNSALSDESVPVGNKQFLQALDRYLNKSFREQSETPTLNRPIYPIFKMEGSKPGIFNFPKWFCKKNNNGKNECEEMSFEQAFVKSTKEQSEEFVEPKFIVDNEMLKIIDEREFFTFSLKSMERSEIVNFGYYEGECLTYYQYEVTTSNAIFGSPYSLTLDFDEFSEVNQGLKNQYKNCYDCKSTYEPEKAFAQLQGVPNLFFTYVDTFDPNNQYDYPQRSLRMMIGAGDFVYLWHEELDLFGCSCL